MLRLRILRNLKESSSSSEIIFCLPILCAHDAIDDKVGATIEDKSKVLESGQGEHPADGKIWLKGSSHKQILDSKGAWLTGLCTKINKYEIYLEPPYSWNNEMCSFLTCLGWVGIIPFAQQRFVLSLTLDWDQGFSKEMMAREMIMK